MNIKEAVTRCQVCAEYQANNPHQPMQTHKIPDTLWSRLTVNLFTLLSKDYIGLVDYYSDYVGVSPVTGITSTAAIKFGKCRSAKMVFHRCLGNQPYLVKREFTECAKQWEYLRVILSLYRPKFKEGAQSSVKVVKNLFEKALKDSKDRG